MLHYISFPFVLSNGSNGSNVSNAQWKVMGTLASVSYLHSCVLESYFKNKKMQTYVSSQ